MRCVALVLLLGSALAIVATPQARADSISMDLDFHFGDADTSGPLHLTFDDQGSAGTVLVTMDAGDLTLDGEYVDAWYFNFDGDATALTFSNSDTTAIGGFSNVTINTSLTQSQQADGDGKYNVFADFLNGAGGPSPNRFEDGETLSFIITGTDIVASDFNLIAAVGGSNGPFFSAAHVSGTDKNNDNEGSDWLGATTVVPEPTSLALVGLGLAGFAGLRRRRRS